MTENLHSAKVAETLHGSRLDHAIVFAGLVSSRSQGQKLISAGKVKVNGKLEKASYKVQKGDEIEALIEGPKDIELVPYDFPVDVIYEDNDVLVVNKPAGLVVHPAYGHESDTLINALLHRKTRLSPSDDVFRPGLVHRIDKGTSGLLVLAKNETSHQHLAKQFENKTTHRRYWALCFSHKSLDGGTISSYLTRDTKNRQRFTRHDSEGKWAITHYKSLFHKPPFSLYELQLETGRTHQIRVHLSSESNPIVGDDTYNGKNVAKNLKNQKLKKLILEMDRFALHAKELGFIHPSTGENLLFNSPIPDDLHELFTLSGFEDYIDFK